MKRKNNNLRKFYGGGVQSELTQGNEQFDNAATKVPVYGQIYGIAKGASGIGKKMIKTDEYGNALNAEGKVANDWLTPDHELIMNAYKKDGIGGALRESSGVGKVGRTISTLTGNDNSTSGGWGKFNKFVGMSPENGPEPIIPPTVDERYSDEAYQNPNKMGNGGKIPDGYQIAHGGWNKPTEKELNDVWYGNPENKDKPYSVQYDSTMVGKRPYYNAYLYGDKPKQFNPQPNQVVNNKPIIVPDPMKQIGYNGIQQGVVETYENGGLGSPNAEVEKQENSVTPNGDFTQYNGPTHQQGGIPTNLEPGEMVFSDKLKLQGTKKTFAELNKANDTNKEDKILENSKSDSTKKLTAELMKKAKMKKSMMLFNEQEAMKKAKLAKYAKRIGISDEQFGNGGMKKYPWGGTEDDTYGMEVPGTTKSSGVSPYSTWAAQDNSNDGLYGNDAANFNESLAKGNREFNPNDFNQPDSASSGSGGNGINWGNVAMQAGQFAVQNAGNFYDMKRAKDVDKEIYNRVTPDLLDSSADLKYNDLQARKAVQDVKNASGGNSSTYIGMRTGIANSATMNAHRINQYYKNANAGIKNQSKYYNAGVGDKETIANLQNQAQARNIKSNAISKTGQNASNQYKDYKAEKMDDKSLELIAARYPEIKNDPEFSKYFKNKKK